MKKLYQEFKDFAFGGGIIGLAVAFVMAAAFGALVNALVEEVVMPTIGIIFGEPSFNGLTVTINDSVIFYGAFITALVKFAAVAAGVFFFIVKPYTAYEARVAAGEEEVAAEPSDDIKLLTEIRDGLAKLRHQYLHGCLPGHRDVLLLHVLHHAVMRAFTAQATLFRSTERRRGIRNQAAIQTDHAGIQTLGDRHATADILRV